MNIRLNPEDVRFVSTDIIDRNGRLFFWEGDIYRAISPAMSPLYRKLLQSDHAPRLFSIGLVETEIAPIVLYGYDLVLKHRKVPFVSYATEWCGGMLKDAALLTLDLSLALVDLGLELQDAHPWNILFDGCKPKFIDFGSIVPIRQTDIWRPSREFIGMFYNPLRLMSAGCADQARSLFVDPRKRASRRVQSRNVLLALLRERKLRQFFDALWQLESPIASGQKEAIVGLQDRVVNLSIPLIKTSWSDYCIEEVDLSKQDEWIVKRKIVFDIITRIRPRTLLDIGSNTGWFSKLAAMQGSRVIATDNDDTCINWLYLNEEAHKLNILPLVMDFRQPTPAYGISLRCAPAIDRFRVDMVLGLAIVHHLVFKQKLGFDVIVKNLAAFTERWLLVEFIPREDKYVSKWYDERFAWYTLDGFVKVLRQHFRKVEQLPSNPEPRLMLLCER